MGISAFSSGHNGQKTPSFRFKIIAYNFTMNYIIVSATNNKENL